MQYIEVLLNVPFGDKFTYGVTDELCKETDFSLTEGFRVEVPFGNGNRKQIGYVTKVFDKDYVPQYEKSKIKNINKIIDKEKVFTDELVSLSKWISDFYLCTQGEALSSMIPSGKKETDFSLGFEEDSSAYVPKTLSDEQQKAVDDILEPNNKTLYHYLYGQTGSGKTEVFLSVAERVLAQGKSVIYLVPEISLTGQVIEAVVNRFGKTAAILHSGLTPSQKLKEWNRILNNEARVVVGARSAVFAPLQNLGLIILDEEHDSSYKSNNSPRYHCRQVAMKRCLNNKVPLLMGSATPSVESYYQMESGLILKHTLTKRLAGGKEPTIKIVDLSSPITKKITNSLSEQLYNEIIQTKEEKRQTILFLNRRGFTHFFKCNTCGFEYKCKNCSVSLTYHKNQNRLRCHYCGFSIYPPKYCPNCNSLDIGSNGIGTEFIEEEVRNHFPTYSIDRIDTDTLTNKKALNEKIAAFKNGEIDILLGTQMVAKGLNFPGLKLVGVVLADTGLQMPDFRATERTFSLIVQVAGRAGRFFPDGKVLVQTYNPQNPAIMYACKTDCKNFYNQEIETRQMLGFPPSARLLRLVFRSANSQASYLAAETCASLLNKMNTENSFDVLGPSECALNKIALNYRYQILLRSNNITCLQKAVSVLMNKYKPAGSVYIEIDIDPISLL